MRITEQHMVGFWGKNPSGSAFGNPTDSVVRLGEELSAGSVLDLGAGDGRHALYLAEKGLRVKAVDLSPSGIEKLARLAKERGLDIETVVADVATYSVNTDYSAFVAVLIFQFLDEATSLRLLNDMKAHTAPGGLHVVHVFTRSGDRQRLDLEEDPNSNCFYPADGWLKEFYGDWEIVEHELSSGPLIGKISDDGTSMTSIVERVLVRKTI